MLTSKRDLIDSPCISKREAAILFNLGFTAFDRRWEEYYSYHIPHVETTHGLQIGLYQAMQFAYPEIKKPGEIGALCLDFSFRLAGMRKRRRRHTKKNGGNDS